jgi:hypothetical protein
MILVARKVVEQIAEHHKHVSASREVAAGKTLPGYRSYQAVLEARVAPDKAEERSPADDVIIADEG